VIHIRLSLVGLGSFGLAFGLGLRYGLRLELTLRNTWSLGNEGASCLQKPID